MKLFWLLASGVCIIAAAIFVWRLDFNKAFVVAAIGVVCWFLNYRAQLTAALKAADQEADEREGSNGDLL